MYHYIVSIVVLQIHFIVVFLVWLNSYDCIEKKVPKFLKSFRENLIKKKKKSKEIK